MTGQKVDQRQGSTKECEDNFWMHHKADKGGGTDSTNMSEKWVWKLKLSEAAPLHRIYAQHTSKTKHEMIVKLEDDQGGGGVNTTEVASKVSETVAVTVCMWETMPNKVKNQMISVATIPTKCQVHPYCSDTSPTNNPTQMSNVVCLFHKSLPGPTLVLRFQIATNQTTFQKKTLGNLAKNSDTKPNRVYLSNKLLCENESQKLSMVNTILPKTRVKKSKWISFQLLPNSADTIPTITQAHIFSV